MRRIDHLLPLFAHSPALTGLVGLEKAPRVEVGGFTGLLEGAALDWWLAVAMCTTEPELKGKWLERKGRYYYCYYRSRWGVLPPIVEPVATAAAVAPVTMPPPSPLGTASSSGTESGASP